MKINWFSNAPWSPTGYGNQTKTFVPRLAKLGHEMSITSFYGLEGATINVNGILVHPRQQHPYGQDILLPYALAERADVVLTLVDAFVLQPQRFEGFGPKLIPWFPVDSDPIKPMDAETVKQCYARIVFSKFGLEKCAEAGLSAYYVPHGVDTQLFEPLDRADARRILGWPADRFVVGMVAANKGYPPRKAFFEQLQAFAAFHAKHPDALLYIHTEDGAHEGRETVHLPEYLANLKLKYAYMNGRPIAEDTAVLFPDQFGLIAGYPDAYMVNAYNAMDVHMLVSAGEGFGIPILEAQACGTPVIVGDWTAMSELCFGGWKVDKRDATKTWTMFRTYQFYPKPEAVLEKLEASYRMRGNMDYRTRARDGAMRYDADKVTEKYWGPVLAEIADAIHRPPMVAVPAGAAALDLVAGEVAA